MPSRNRMRAPRIWRPESWQSASVDDVPGLSAAALNVIDSEGKCSQSPQARGRAIQSLDRVEDVYGAERGLQRPPERLFSTAASEGRIGMIRILRELLQFSPPDVVVPSFDESGRNIFCAGLVFGLLIVAATLHPSAERSTEAHWEHIADPLAKLLSATFYIPRFTPGFSFVPNRFCQGSSRLDERSPESFGGASRERIPRVH
ncbi:hypothetical protein DFH06DRAFT_1473353 [Mycena polygramma]|nr:hypothetical protein DFH06DRAFT_1473353 [Mycena polygramma]